jgi:hypothetical protein
MNKTDLLHITDIGRPVEIRRKDQDPIPGTIAAFKQSVKKNELYLVLVRSTHGNNLTEQCFPSEVHFTDEPKKARTPRAKKAANVHKNPAGDKASGK